MNYIFLLLSNDSFYEAVIMSSLVEAIPLGTEIFCFTGSLQTIYFSENKRICKIFLQENIEENRKLFERVINEGEISGIFIFDFEKALLDRKNIFFDPVWLENLDIPILIVDYLDAFAYDLDGIVYLKHSEKFNHLLSEEKPVKVSSPYAIYPYLLKNSPPANSLFNQNKNIIFWNAFNYESLTELEMKQNKTIFGLREDSKNVLLLFSYQLLMRSVVVGENNGHYPLIVDTICHFLDKLDADINLFIIGMGDEIKVNLSPVSERIKIRIFKTINHDLYKNLFSLADLIITDSTWQPVLISAALSEKPAAVIGNSLSSRDDGSFQADFEYTDNEILAKLTKFISINPKIFFPYTSFPLLDEKFPGTNFYQNKFFYYLLDIFSENSVMPFLNAFLGNDPLFSADYQLALNEYLQTSANSISSEQLIDLFQV